jgi:hypothetical protein
MKRIAFFAVFALTLAGCGGGDGGGGGTTPEQAVEDSFEAFGEIIESCIPQAQVLGAELEAAFPGIPVMKGEQSFEAGKAVETCNCPGGGTATVDTTLFTLTATGCSSTEGEVFTGTMSLSAQGNINANFTQFGECTNATGTNIVMDGCGGTISGTCAGANVTCTVIVDPDAQNQCALTCS